MDMETRDEVLAFIIAYKKAHGGTSPSFREIMDALGISSTSIVHDCVESLEEDGLIIREKGKVRSIQIPGEQYTN